MVSVPPKARLFRLLVGVHDAYEGGVIAQGCFQIRGDHGVLSTEGRWSESEGFIHSTVQHGVMLDDRGYDALVFSVVA